MYDDSGLLGFFVHTEQQINHQNVGLHLIWGLIKVHSESKFGIETVYFDEKVMFVPFMYSLLTHLKYSLLRYNNMYTLCNLILLRQAQDKIYEIMLYATSL